MGVVGVLGAGLIVAAARALLPRSRTAFLGAAAVAAWAAVMAGAAACAAELALSGTIPLNTVVPAMLSVHAVIGVGEAVITVAALSAILASRPDLVAGRAPVLATAEGV